MIIYFYIGLLLFTSIKSLIRLFRTKKYLNSKYKLKVINNRIKVIIPAMNEVNNVYESVKYFKNLKLCDVIYVTTIKEKSMATYNKLIDEIRKQDAKNIKAINCPNTFGTMAHQLNYAVKDLKAEDIIAIYNIDSRPEDKTFSYVLNNIDNVTVLQQVSYFDDKHKWIIASAQNWQNRWSIVYEMGKYISNKKLEFKYCIGHGLFLKKTIFDKYGLFSEKDINEDNEFGYRLAINNIHVKPIPYLEKADFAKNLKIYVKQQSTWVNGPLYAFKYYRNNKKSIINFILSVLNFKAFISWWLFPLFNLIFIIIALFTNIKLFIVSFLLLIFYITGINYMANKILISHGYVKNKYNINILSDLLFFIIHSFGSYITMYKLIMGKNNIKNKYNTEK